MNVSRLGIRDGRILPGLPEPLGLEDVRNLPPVTPQRDSTAHADRSPRSTPERNDGTKADCEKLGTLQRAATASTAPMTCDTRKALSSFLRNVYAFDSAHRMSISASRVRLNYSRTISAACSGVA